MNDESDNSITGRMAFMNDRFYLDASPYLENCAVQPEEAADYARRFSRSQYLQQIHNSDENIQCVLMSTYRLDWEYLQEEFPHLFDKNLAIPCLVLHGEKREEEKQWWSRYDPLNSEIDEDDSSYTHLHECIIPNMEGETISSDGSGHVPRDGNVGNGNPNMEIREVIPQFNFPDDASSDHLSAGISRNVAGVHHPKYMLVFTDIRLHVVISTANLTKNGSVDASWMQYFPRCTAKNKDEASSENESCSSFGIVLQDFINKQSQQLHFGISAHVFNILEWIKIHTGIDNLQWAFDFSSAEVELVSTVPSRVPLPDLSEQERIWLYNYYQFDIDLIAQQPCDKCQLESLKLSKLEEVKYGSLRIKELMQRFGTENRNILSQQDVLVMQPTSIGIGIDNSFIGALLGHFMPEDIWEQNIEYLRQESWRLIWPSRETMIGIYNNAKEGSQKTVSENDYTMTESNHINQLSTKDHPQFAQGLLFLHARNFSLMEPDIQSQFYTYVPSKAKSIRDLSLKHVPHIKSYCRIAAPSCSSVTSDCNSCICYPLRWAVITSACLSRGAQGVSVPYTICSQCRHVRKGYWDYKNFELGVLLQSTNERQYRGLNENCPIHGVDNSKMEQSAGQSRYIILPFPFNLLHGSVPFCNEVGKMNHDLFFHPPSPDITTKYPDICTDSLKEQVKLKRSQTAPLLRSRSLTGSPGVEGDTSCALGKRSFSVVNALSKCHSLNAADVQQRRPKRPHSFPLPLKKPNPTETVSTGIAFIKQLHRAPPFSEPFQSISVNSSISVDDHSNNSAFDSSVHTEDVSLSKTGSIVDFML